MLLAAAATVRADSVGPTIDVWYGTPQAFGSPGLAQQWANVLGNVSDPDGVDSLTYTLNGGPVRTLSRGPDNRRLLETGDFNIDIDFLDLAEGANDLVITARDSGQHTSVANVTLNYSAATVWPLPYVPDLSGGADVGDVVQVIDGEWTITSNRLRCPTMGYDRTFAIGDLDWTDYEVTATFTMLDLDPAGYNWPSVSPGFGMTLRWSGHSDNPVVCAQPHCGWLPSGASVWYDAGHDGPLMLDGDLSLFQQQGRTLEFDVPYVFKMRVENAGAQGTFYAVKVWPAGSPEPGAWDLSGNEPVGDVPAGSCLFIAHHMDVLIENVSVTALGDVTPPVISNVQVAPAQDSAVVTWTTNEPATSRVDFGLTAAYGQVSTASNLVTAHNRVLTGLAPETLYHHRITSTDASGNPQSTADQTFTTQPASPPELVTDQFNQPSLDTAVWTFVDPLGDSSVSMTGTQARIEIPVTASDHEIWINGNTAPRILQAAPDDDFEVVVKFDSPLAEELQIHGICVEQDADNVVRSEFHHLGGLTYVYVASIFGGNFATHAHAAVPLTPPMYMRVNRTGNDFTVSRSDDGENWTVAAAFTQAMTVSAVGIHAGAPAGASYTLLADFFLNTAEPQLTDCNANGIADVQDIAAGTSADCNASDVPDECELAGNDCNANSVPDECDTDCNTNGTPDDCESLADCNSNGSPDACETFTDCNASGVPDECELAGNDCNNDGAPDDCQLAGSDCNTNGVPDECDPDCNTNGTPDDCESITDCNATGVPDECELAGNDCNANGVPDECDADCDASGTPDACETLPDCNSNGTPDACEPFDDCNADDIPDECELAGNDCNSNATPDDCETLADCNANSVPDECESLADCNTNGTPDECEAIIDCNADNVPDECELIGNDCNSDDIPDDCQVAGNDCNNDAVPDDCQLIGSDCNTNGVPDACDPDADGNGVPDDCEEHADCNTNGWLDAAEIAAGSAQDANADFVPDECQVRNLTQATAFATLADALATANSGDELLANLPHFLAAPMIDFAGRALTLRSTSDIVQPPGASMTLADNARLASAPGSDVVMAGSLTANPLNDFEIQAARFLLDPGGSLTLPASTGALITAPAGGRLDGATVVQPQATLAFSSAVNVGGNFSLLGGVATADGLTIAGPDAQLYGYGSIVADVVNNADLVIIADTQILGDLTNDGVTTIQSGTLTLAGSLFGNGAIIGDLGRAGDTPAGEDPQRGGDSGLFVTGDFAQDADATLAFPSPAWTLRVGGDFDVAIDVSQHFQMASAELRFVGTGPSEQTLETLSVDIGPSSFGLDPQSVGNFPIGTLRVGPTPTTVRLVDAHDNAPPIADVEALYVDTLIIDAGATLQSAGLRVYYRTLTLDGAVDAPENLIAITGPPGDCDLDGDVDSTDAAAMIECLAGPAALPPQAAAAGCDCSATFDFDLDTDVDLQDFSAMQEAWARP